MPCGLDAIVSLAISPDFATDQTLVAGSENNGLWLSPDGGRSWQRLAEGLLEEPANSLLFLTGSGTAGLLAVTSSGLWHSQAPFNTWCNLLPDEYAGRELTAACPLLGENEALKIAAGFVDGEIVIIPT